MDQSSLYQGRTRIRDITLRSQKLPYESLKSHRKSIAIGVLILAALAVISCGVSSATGIPNSATLRKPASSGNEINITVSRTGYSPSQIEVKKGEPVKLAFYREDDQNCGGEVIFPSLNSRTTLPAGKTTGIDVTPNETGDLVFTCGMGMLRGRLIVE